MLSKQEELRVASYLKDYAQYLTSKAEKEYSAIIRIMIGNTIVDIQNIANQLEGK